ncbi:S-layer homology domain-containing protein [Bacillus tianshenii]|nr:S-layer homology domain-containing protein [Bacillus tianshenii]
MAYQPKSFRKFLATSVTTAVVASAVAPLASAASFTDVQSGDWFSEAVDYLTSENILNGYEDGSFKPQGELTRAEAAKILATALNLDTEGAADPNFSDLSAGHWAFDYVAALTEAGVINGYEDGTFQPNKKVSRAEVAKMVAESYDAGETGTSSLTDIDGHWAKGYIAALVDEGVINGYEDNSFKPNNTITRAEAAKVIYETLNSDLVAPKLEVADLRFKDSKTLVVTLKDMPAEGEEVTADNFRVLVDGEKVTPESVEANGKEVVITHADLDGEVGTVEVNGVELDFDFTSLAVAEVETPNLRQVAVVFNQDVTGNEDVEDEDNYSFEDTDGKDLETRNGKDVEVVDVKIMDGNIALLTLNDAVDNQEEGKIIIDEAVVGEELEYDLEFSDTEVPEVEDVQVIGEDSVKVIFSEPMDVFESALLDDDSYEVTSKDGDKTYRVRDVKAVDAGKEAIIEVGGTFEDGEELTVTIDNGIEDYADFALVKESFDVTVEENNEPIEIVGFRKAQEDEVTLIFNKDLRDVDTDLDNYYHTNSKENPYKVELDGNELTLHFDSDNELPDGTAYIYIEDEALEDYWGNQNEQTLRFAVDVTVDNEAPKVEDIEATTDEIVVEFDETVDEDSATDEDNYKILDADGEEVEDTEISSVTLKNDDKTVEIDLKGDELSGAATYTLVIDGVEDEQANATDGLEEEFEVDVEDPVDLNEVLNEDTALYVDDEDEDEIEYTVNADFGRKMTVGDDKYAIDNLANYTVKWDGKDYTLEDLADEDGFDVEIDTIDDEEVEIKIYADTDEHGDDLWKNAEGKFTLPGFTMLRVKDANGDLTDAAYATKTLVEADTANELAIDDNKVEATAVDTIEFEFTKRIDNFNADNFSLETEDGTELAYDIEIGDDDKTVTITLDEDDELSDNAELNGENVYLVLTELSDDNTDTAYGETLDYGKYLVSDEIAPEFDDEYFEDDDKANTDGYEDGYYVEKDTEDNLYRITLGFSEMLDDTVSVAKVATTLDIESDGDDVSYDAGLGEDETYKLAVEDDKLILIVKDSDTDNVDISFSENNAFTDLANNKVLEFSTSVDLDEAVNADIVGGGETPNNAPTVANEVSDKSVVLGNDLTVDISNTFADADNDELTYSVASEDEAVATASVDGEAVTVSPVAEGTATITVTANDGEDTVSTTFVVTVQPEGTTVQEISASNETAMFGSTITVTATGYDEAVNYVVYTEDGAEQLTAETAVGESTTAFPAQVDGGKVTVKLLAADGSEVASEVVTLD